MNQEQTVVNLDEFEKTAEKDSVIILTKSGTFMMFNGKYRRDLETNNWHYWETKAGKVIHCRKENIESVYGGTVEEVVNARISE